MLQLVGISLVSRRSAVLALSLASGFVAATAPAVAAVSPGTPGVVIYARQIGTGPESLYALIPGSPDPSIVPGTAGARGGRLSPDGRIIAFTRMNDGLYLVNPDGSGLRQILPPDVTGLQYGMPVWSPDGRALAFSIGFDGDVAILTDPATAPTRISPGFVQLWDWTPDGRLVGSTWVSDPSSPGDRSTELATILPDGSDLTVITATPTINEEVPRVSPDGSKVVFLSTATGPGPLDYRVAVSAMDGSDRHDVADLGTLLSWPAWSPDGTEIVAGLTDPDLASHYIPAAFRVDGSGFRHLTEANVVGDSYDWGALPGTTAPIARLGVLAAAGPDPSAKTTARISSTSLWPVRDGHHDTTRIVQGLREPARSTIYIYNPTGRLIRRVVIPYRTGSTAWSWNGRSASGRMLGAGRYRLVAVARDFAGNVHRTTFHVTLSHR